MRNSRIVSNREVRSQATASLRDTVELGSTLILLSAATMALVMGLTLFACSDEADAGCERTGQFGDGVRGQDRCWQPPENYCSGGATQLVTKACSPDESYCCQFGDGCFPCGWRDCTVVGGVGCGGVPMGTEEQCGASDVRPTHDPICLD